MRWTDDFVTAGVVWVTTEPPRHAGGGGNQRQANLLRALAEHAPVDLLVLGPVEDDRVLASVRRLVVVPPDLPRSVPRPIRRARAAATAWVRHQPLDVAGAARARDGLARELGPLARGAAAVLLHHQVLGPLLDAPRDGPARRVLSLFHAAADRALQEAAVEANPLQRALLRRDGVNARRFEQRFVDQADALVVITEADARRLGRPGTPTHVVPQGVDLDRIATTALPDDPVVLFSGSLDYTPNVDGVTWFAAEIWPLIRAVVPEARLVVVGRQPTPAVVALRAQEGIEVHADVPSMDPWLAMARVSVAPLRIGTGIRVKALEALAAGVPVVGTTVGLEGVPVTEAEASVADQPADFAAAVVELLRDDTLARERQAAGRALAEARFSWKAAGQALADALA